MVGGRVLPVRLRPGALRWERREYSSSVSSTGGTKPAPMPWMGCGPGAPPLTEHQTRVRDEFGVPRSKATELRVLALPGVQDWITGALAEKDFLDFEEPYRLQR